MNDVDRIWRNLEGNKGLWKKAGIEKDEKRYPLSGV